MAASTDDVDIDIDIDSHEPEHSGAAAGTATGAAGRGLASLGHAGGPSAFGGDGSAGPALRPTPELDALYVGMAAAATTARGRQPKGD